MAQLLTKVVTGPVRLSYAHLFEPYAQQEDQTPKYSVQLLVPKTDTETIQNDITGLTNERPGPGTLYGSIKRLLADGLIEESDERPDADLDDQRRRYYRLTGLGERVCAAELSRLQALIRRAGSPEWARRFIPRPGEA